VSAPALLDRHVRIPVIISGCFLCFGTGKVFAKPGVLIDCPNGCAKPQDAPAEQHAPHGAYGCPGCPCAPVDCESGACCCPCCCIHNYPLPAVASLAPAGTEVPMPNNPFRNPPRAVVYALAVILPFLAAAVLIISGVIR